MTPLDRIAIALEALLAEQKRAADALERIATEPSGKLPTRRRSQRREHKATPPPVDEVARAKARRALERAGVR